LLKIISSLDCCIDSFLCFFITSSLKFSNLIHISSFFGSFESIFGLNLLSQFFGCSLVAFSKLKFLSFSLFSLHLQESFSMFGNFDLFLLFFLDIFEYLNVLSNFLLLLLIFLNLLESFSMFCDLFVLFNLLEIFSVFRNFLFLSYFLEIFSSFCNFLLFLSFLEDLSMFCNLIFISLFGHNWIICALYELNLILILFLRIFTILNLT
jgi:hypothetical protein